MLEEAGKVIGEWWGMLLATPFIAIGTKRLLNTYTKKDVDTLLDARIEPLHETITKNTLILEKTNELLTDVRIKMAERREGD